MGSMVVYVVSVEGLIGAGKSTLIQSLSQRHGGQLCHHPVLGSYHLLGDIMAVEENVKLYNLHGCLDANIIDPSLSTFMALKVQLDCMVTIHSALAHSMKHGVSVLIIERHLLIGYHTFGSMASDQCPSLTPFTTAEVETIYMKLQADFGSFVAGGKFMHGIVYLKATQQQAILNIKKRMHEADRNLIKANGGGIEECVNNQLLEERLVPVLKRMKVPLLELEPV